MFKRTIIEMGMRNKMDFDSQCHLVIMFLETWSVDNRFKFLLDVKQYIFD